jgi:glycosyltransferase involved in cell wall biosynthesis
VKLSIVIPAFNEGGKIQRDIQNAREFLVRSLDGNGEIIVVDDGSTDDTAIRARSMAAGIPRSHVICYTPRRGKGHALRAGIAQTRGEYVMFADAGSCVPYQHALRGLELCQAGVHLAHGSRRTQDSIISNPQPVYRRLGSGLFRLFVRAFLGIPRHLRDTQCGFKIYRGDCARRIYREIFTEGFMFDIEVIRRARKGGLTMAEFPIQWSVDRDTRFQPATGTFANLVELVRIGVRC